MPERWVLIAPHGVDLDAIGHALAAQLATTAHSVYDFSDDQWALLGYDAGAEIMALAQGGVYASYRLMMPMRLRAVEKLLAEIKSGVLILPPEFTIYDDLELQSQMAALLAPIANVILLTPSPDTAETAALLNADLASFPDWSAVNAYWIRNPSNRRLAKHIVYTHGKTEAQTCADILRLKSDQSPSEIILIGPKLTGKTTIGRLLADSLGLRQVSLDNLSRQYYAQTDFDRAKAAQIYTDEGIFSWQLYRQPYDAYLIEGVLRDEHNCVIDFGGGHSVYEDETQFARVQAALAPYPNVVLILPSPDEDESIRILKQRFEADFASEQRLQRLLVTAAAYSQLAKHTVYTHHKTVDVIGAEAVGM